MAREVLVVAVDGPLGNAQAWQMTLDDAEECQLSGPIGELVPFTSPQRLNALLELTIRLARSYRDDTSWKNRLAASP